MTQQTCIFFATFSRSLQVCAADTAFICMVARWDLVNQMRTHLRNKKEKDSSGSPKETATSNCLAITIPILKSTRSIRNLSIDMKKK